MHIIDYVIIGILAICVGIAIHSVIKHKGQCGTCGNCSTCRGCSKYPTCDDPQKQDCKKY